MVELGHVGTADSRVQRSPRRDGAVQQHHRGAAIDVVNRLALPRSPGPATEARSVSRRDPSPCRTRRTPASRSPASAMTGSAGSPAASPAPTSPPFPDEVPGREGTGGPRDRQPARHDNHEARRHHADAGHAATGLPRPPLPRPVPAGPRPGPGKMVLLIPGCSLLRPASGRFATHSGTAASYGQSRRCAARFRRC